MKSAQQLPELKMGAPNPAIVWTVDTYKSSFPVYSADSTPNDDTYSTLKVP